jgi:hypothetical protein
LEGQSLICHIIAPATKFIFSSTMPSLKRPASAIERPVAKQRKCDVCGQLGHNRRKCPAAPAASAAPVVDGQVGDGNDVNSVTEVIPSLLWSYQLEKTTSILIGEVSFMLFSI